MCLLYKLQSISTADSGVPFVEITENWQIQEYHFICQDFKRAGISRLLKEKGREQLWPKKGNLRHTRKNLKNVQNFTTFRVNKMFSHRFYGAGIINYQ
jgi:hypothetical protein